jgi:hypothetical protein
MRQDCLWPSGRLAAYRVALALAVALLCQACAFSYTDASGDHHTVGLVDISIHAPAAPQTFAGDVIDVASIGLSAGRTAQGGYVTLGYSHEISAALRDNALVLGNPLEPARPIDKPKEGAR